MPWFFLLLFASALCWSVWGYVVFSVDPFVSGFLGHALFYASLLLALVGTITAASFGARRRLAEDELPWRQIRASLREGVLFSLLGVFSLYLNARGMLRWWNGFSLVVAVAALEGFFLLHEHARHVSRAVRLRRFPQEEPRESSEIITRHKQSSL